MRPNPTASSLCALDGAVDVCAGGDPFGSVSSIALSFALLASAAMLSDCILEIEVLLSFVLSDSDGCLFCPMNEAGLGAFCENICEYSVMDDDLLLCFGISSVMIIVVVTMCDLG